MEDRKKAIMYALVACVTWGTVYVSIKVGLDHGMRPLTFAGTRFLAGGLILLAIAMFKGGLGLRPRDVWPLALLGFFQTGVQNALFFTGVDLTNAGISAIFINTQPFFVIMLAPLFFRSSRITLLRLVGVAVGFGGVVLISRLDVPRTEGFELGVLALVLSALTWACSNIAAKKLMRTRRPLSVTAVQMATGAVPLLATGVLTEGRYMGGVDATGFAMLGYLVVFATSIPFFAWYKALRTGEVGRVSVFAFTLPVMGVLSGWLLLGERMSISMAGGMAMVAAGIILVNILPAAGRSGGAPGDVLPPPIRP